MVGFNYTFGYQGAGNPEKLQELCSQYGISVTVMEPCCVDDEIVSSSTIRSYLKDGRIEKVNEMLGYVYTVSGVVCQGNQIGRTIRFSYPPILWRRPKLLLPANGVYAALTKVDGVTYPGILNIGLRPTIKNSVGINIEVNLFHFDADIYGKEIEIGIRYFLRSEVKFSGLEALKAQLEKDKAADPDNCFNYKAYKMIQKIIALRKTILLQKEESSVDDSISDRGFFLPVINEQLMMEWE